MTDDSAREIDPVCARCGCYKSAHGKDLRCEPVGWTFTEALSQTDEAMVEKVARALADEADEDPDEELDSGFFRWEVYKSPARAAIEATQR